MKRRDPLLQTLLSLFIPFYIIYWSYATGKDMEREYGHKAPSILLLLVPGIVFTISFIGIFISLLFTSNENEPMSLTAVALLIFSLVSAFLMLALSLVYYYKFSGIVEKIVGPQTSRLLLFILFWFISPAAVYIVEEKLNNLPSQSIAQPPGQNIPPSQGQPPRSPAA